MQGRLLKGKTNRLQLQSGSSKSHVAIVDIIVEQYLSLMLWRVIAGDANTSAPSCRLSVPD